MSAYLTDSQLKILINTIGALETGGQIFGRQRYNAFASPYKNTPGEHSSTAGAFQEFGENLRQLLLRIQKEYPSVFKKYDTAGIAKDISGKAWSASNPYDVYEGTSKANAIIKIISSKEGIIVQDKRIAELIEKYLKYIVEELKVTNTQAAMFLAQCEHLGGKTPLTRIVNRAANKNIIDSLYASLLKDQNDISNNNQIGDKIFQSRHEKARAWIKEKVSSADIVNTVKNSNSTNGSDKEGGETKMGSLDGLFARLNSDIGYQEKASNAYLDSKSKNAGYNNYQKFSRDINNAGLMGCQAQPWCGSCQFAEEMYEFGVDIALKHYNMTRSTYTAYNVFSTREAFRKVGKYSKTPKLGALVVFKQSHIGRVVGITSTHITTIEGNTSAAYGDRNGGCVKKKVYNRNDSIIDGYCIIDYEDDSFDEVNASNSSRTYLQRGDSGSAVKDLQAKLNKCGYDCGTADGIFGAKTESAVRKFQKANKLTVDALAGNDTMSVLNATYAKITSASKTSANTWVKQFQKAIGAKQDGIAGSETLGKCPMLKSGSTGTTVKLLQQYLIDSGIVVSGGADGIFGAGTKSAVKKYQKAKGLLSDGIVGHNTWKKILKL